MKETVETIYRSVAELGELGRFAQYDDPLGRLETSPAYVAMMQSNPYLHSADQPAAMLGLVGKRIIGGIGPFPLHVVADGKVYEASAGDSLFVDPDYRKTGYALEIVDRLNSISKDQISLNSGLSRMAQKLFRMLGICVFPLKRYPLVRRSRLLLGGRFPKRFSGVLCFLADCAFFFHRLILKVILKTRTIGWTCEPIALSDENGVKGFCDLIQGDAHRFRQDIDMAWVKWVMTTDFHSFEEARKTLCVVKKKDEVVGYFLTRLTEGGRRGVVLEWQVTPDHQKDLPWLLLKASFALLDQGAETTVLSVPTDETLAVRVLRRLLPKMSDQVVAVGVGPQSPLLAHLGFEKAENWRLRHGMGDASFY